MSVARLAGPSGAALFPTPHSLTRGVGLTSIAAGDCQGGLQRVRSSGSARMGPPMTVAQSSLSADAGDSALFSREDAEEGPQGLKAVLFDIDGTLADSDPLHFLAFTEILLEVGFNDGQPITEDFFKARISGRHNPDITADFFPSWDKPRREAFTEDKEARFRRLALTQLEPLAGLKAFCDWLDARGVPRAAVTNAPRENAEQMIRGLGLSDFFHHLVLGSDCARAKPFSDPYLRAMELLGVAPAECFAIEDSPAGARAAVAAGVATVGVMTSQDSSALLNVGCVLAVKDYADPQFLDFVEKRSGASTALLSPSS